MPAELYRAGQPAALPDPDLLGILPLVHDEHLHPLRQGEGRREQRGRGLTLPGGGRAGGSAMPLARKVPESDFARAVRAVPRRPLPVIDIGRARAGDPLAIEAVAKQWREVWETRGFLCIVNPGLEPAAMPAMHEVPRPVPHLPPETPPSTPP